MSSRFYPILLCLAMVACQPANETTQEVDEKSDTVRETTSPLDTILAVDFVTAYQALLKQPWEGEEQLIRWMEDRPGLTDALRQEYGSLFREARVANPELGLGYDPVLLAQDFPDENGYVIEHVDAESGLVTVTSTYWEGFHVRVRLVQRDGEWLIDGAGEIRITERMRIR